MEKHYIVIIFQANTGTRKLRVSGKRTGANNQFKGFRQEGKTLKICPFVLSPTQEKKYMKINIHFVNHNIDDVHLRISAKAH